MPGDDELLAAAAEGIARLNRRHGPAPDGGERFLLFHRRRSWNESERKWIGWERKRGKLHELNRLLRGATDTTLHADRRPSRLLFPPASATSSRSMPTRGCHGEPPHAWSARWRIRSTGRGSIPHVGRVVEGYAVLQPRVTPTLPTDREGSLFQRIFSGPGRHRPVRLRRLRRLPGSFRRRFLHRQRDLRRRRIRGGARRTGAGEHASKS